MKEVTHAELLKICTSVPERGCRVWVGDKTTGWAFVGNEGKITIAWDSEVMSTFPNNSCCRWNISYDGIPA